MKKIIFVFALLFITNSSFSKTKFGLDLSVGLKAGLNLNKMSGPGIKDQFATDPHAGFFAYLNKKKFGIQVEGVWTQNRIITDSTFYGFYKQYYRTASDSLNEGAFRFQTLAIPILLNIKLNEIIWIQVGPQFSSNVNLLDKNKLLQSGFKVVNDGSLNAVGGLWFQFGGKSPVVRLNAGARYIVGIDNMSELIKFDGNKGVWRNQMIQVHLGISY